MTEPLEDPLFITHQEGILGFDRSSLSMCELEYREPKELNIKWLE